MTSHRVLMVDDDRFAFRILQSFLEDMKQPPVLEYAETYEEGMRRLMTEPFDVCLLDYQLGKESGLRFLAELKQRGSHVPVVMLTASRDAALDHEAMHGGAVDFLVKGEFGPEVLERVIRYAAERARNEERLRESEERYALAVAGANDGIWDWKLTQKSLYLSPRWKQIIGFADTELPNEMAAWFDRVHPEDVERFRSELNSHVEGSRVHLDNEHRILHRDGTWRWVLARADAVRDASGRATRIAGSLTDVTSARSRDALTGLPNRLLYMDRLERAFARKRRDKDFCFAVLFMDLDRFKVLNDSLGHQAGDELLIGIARRLEKCVRGMDSVARLGGDEFTLLLEGVPEPAGAVKIAERILEELALPFEILGRAVYSGASIGIAMSRPEYDRPEEILRDADTAMYRAKSGGRMRYQIFDQRMHDEAMVVLQLENELREAVSRDELRVLYQPIIGLNDGQLMGFEALVRWQHPRLGFITPDRFIGLAEETGAVEVLDQWVLSKSAEQLGKWQSQYPAARGLYLAVNASKRHFNRLDYVDQVLDAIDKGQVARGAVALEITESLIFDDPERVMGILERLRNAGVQLVMDDFGTGYSSLAYLHKLPITGLKVDRSFVARLDQPGPAAEAVRAIIALANGLGLTVTAEGVETTAQRIQLVNLGCANAQGYLFAKPLKPEDAEKLLRNRAEAAA